MERIFQRLSAVAEQNNGDSMLAAPPIRLENVISLAARSARGPIASRMRRLAPQICNAFDADGCLIAQTRKSAGSLRSATHAYSPTYPLDERCLQALVAHPDCAQNQIVLVPSGANCGSMIVVKGMMSRLVLSRNVLAPSFTSEDAELAGAFWRACGMTERKSDNRYVLSLPSKSVYLPPRVHQVLSCLIDGLVEKQIASVLSISQHTVHTHIKRLYQQLGVTSRAELFSRCMSLRLYGPVSKRSAVDPGRRLSRSIAAETGK
jgi:DNA-binding CsgD family transcriptional regulator